MSNEKNYKPLTEKDLKNLTKGDIVYFEDTKIPFTIEKIEYQFIFNDKNESWTYTSFAKID